VWKRTCQNSCICMHPIYQPNWLQKTFTDILLQLSSRWLKHSVRTFSDIKLVTQNLLSISLYLMCEDAETRYTVSVKKHYVCCGSDLIRILPILVCLVLEQCLAIDFGHFTVVGKILFLIIFKQLWKLLEDYRCIIKMLQKRILPTTVKCPRSIAKHRIHNTR